MVLLIGLTGLSMSAHAHTLEVELKPTVTAGALSEGFYGPAFEKHIRVRGEHIVAVKHDVDLPKAVHTNNSLENRAVARWGGPK